MAATGESTQQTIEAEVANVKAAYPNRCRVMKDVGGFSHVITVQPGDMDATVKFQIPSTYPTALPTISIRSGSVTQDDVTDLTDSLTSHASKLVGSPMIQELIDEVCRLLTSAGLRPGKARKVKEESDLCANGKSKKKTHRPKKKNDEEEDEADEKLPPMKTASDVVNRIIWDGELEKDDFVVGYWDRFRGLMERSFSAFSWEDLASVDYDVLAVPKHRIQYFKYKDVKVWDKSRRLDDVFGSARGTRTIDVVVKELQELEVHAQSQREVERREGEGGNRSGDSYTDDDSDDSDDDDGIVVNIGANTGIGMKQGTPHAGSNSRVPVTSANGKIEDEELDAAASGRTGAVDEPEGHVDGFNRFWRDKLRPNYFICVRLTAPSILDQFGEVQDHLLSQESVLAECCIPGAALHVTLCTLGLDTAQQVQMCVEALNKVKAELAAARPRSPLRLSGVSQFFNRVVYAQVQHGDDFLPFCDLLKTLLREAGVQIRDGYEFVPHATIMKTTRPVSRMRGSKNIRPELYAKFKDADFGEQAVESIFLCSMDRLRRTDGFYLTPLELNLKS